MKYTYPKNNYYDLQRLENEYAKLKIKCKCGTKTVMPVWIDKSICRGCGHWVYRNKKIELIEKLKQKGVEINGVN